MILRKEIVGSVNKVHNNRNFRIVFHQNFIRLEVADYLNFELNFEEKKPSSLRQDFEVDTNFSIEEPKIRMNFVKICIFAPSVTFLISQRVSV